MTPSRDPQTATHAPPDEVVTVLPRDRTVFGMQLPIQSQSTIYVQPWEPDAGAAELAEVARACEEAGFFYVAVCDHTFIPDRLAAAMGATWYDTVATLGWLAGLTSRIHLLSHVYVAALRHPLRAAKEFATLDRLSDGRVICGIGAGHVREEFDLMGPPFEQRGKAADEAVRALARGLASPEPDPGRTAVAGRRGGHRAAAGAIATAADLGGGLVACGIAPGRTAGRRMVAPVPRRRSVPARRAAPASP